MKQNPIDDIVEARLDAIKCNPAPALVKQGMSADFHKAVIELAEVTITPDAFARKVRDVFAPRKKGTDSQKDGQTQENS